MLDPTQKFYSELIAKDEVAIDLLAALYALHPSGDAVFAAMEKRKINQGYGSGPMADAMQANAQNELSAFRERVAEIRREVQI